MTEPTTHAPRKTGSYATLLFPLLFIVVFLMHFREPAQFFHFKLHYTQPDPTRIVTALVRAQNHWSIFSDPHIIGYLALPFLMLCAYALFTLARPTYPRLSGLALFISAAGTIYLGGVFGMWTAFYRGLGGVDPRYLDGAIATFRAMSAPQGAFLLTTTLAKLSLLGLAAQSLILCRVPHIPRRGPVCIAAGSLLVVAFWDLDNWMLIGMALVTTGFLFLHPYLNRTEQSAQQ